MGSIAVDKGIAKVGAPRDFYDELDPEQIAQHILATARGEIRELVERIMEREHIGDELTDGPASDRTRRMIETAMGPAVDRAVGPASPAVRVAVGRREHDAIRSSVAAEAVDYTTTPLSDLDLHRRQSPKVREMIAGRMRELAPGDFSELLRAAMREDEWLLYLHGAVLGFGGGLIHLALFG